MQNKVKILHITQSFGGVQTYICNIIEYANKEQFEFAVACQPSSLFTIAKNLNAKVFDVPFVREPQPIKDIIALYHLIKIIKQYKPDVIHAHSAKGGFLGRVAGKLTGIKTLFTPNAFSYLGFYGVKRKIFMLIEKFARFFTDTLLAVSESEKCRAIEELGYSTQKVRVVPNSIKIHHSERNFEFRNTIGMIGRLIYQKNPQMFIKVAIEVHKKFPKVKFLLLGEGYLDFLKEEVYKMIDENNAKKYINILQWGKHDVVSFFNQIDVLLLPSRFEGLPFALLEAMMNKVPVIATNVDGNKDVIEDGVDGFLVNEDDVQEMEKRVEMLLVSQEERQKFGMAGFQKVNEKFNILSNIKKIEELYKS